jgi:hypothetical protein
LDYHVQDAQTKHFVTKRWGLLWHSCYLHIYQSETFTGVPG